MTGRDRTYCDAEHGSATLWTVAVALVVMLSTAAVLLIAIAISARHRVAAAADLSALAAASVLASAQVAGDSITTSASEQACRVARDIADANGARLSECQINGSTVDVLTTLTVPAIGYLGEHSVSAHARAGPS